MYAIDSVGGEVELLRGKPARKYREGIQTTCHMSVPGQAESRSLMSKSEGLRCKVAVLSFIALVARFHSPFGLGRTLDATSIPKELSQSVQK
jgi:hypothetical protein